MDRQKRQQVHRNILRREEERHAKSGGRVQLTLPQIAGVVTQQTLTVGTLKALGQITPDKAWVAAKGATRFLLALLKPGGMASQPVAERRAGICAACPNRKVVDGFAYCGEPFRETAQTCGCLIDGKVRVRAEDCPSGLWPKLEA